MTRPNPWDLISSWPDPTRPDPTRLERRVLKNLLTRPVGRTMTRQQLCFFSPATPRTATMPCQPRLEFFYHPLSYAETTVANVLLGELLLIATARHIYSQDRIYIQKNDKSNAENSYAIPPPRHQFCRLICRKHLCNPRKDQSYIIICHAKNSCKYATFTPVQPVLLSPATPRKQPYHVYPAFNAFFTCYAENRCESFRRRQSILLSDLRQEVVDLAERR